MSKIIHHAYQVHTNEFEFRRIKSFDLSNGIQTFVKHQKHLDKKSFVYINLNCLLRFVFHMYHISSYKLDPRVHIIFKAKDQST